MKYFLALPLALAASMSFAQTNPFLATESLTVTQQRLSHIPDKTADEQFALGAVRFLQGIEKTLQVRWQHNASFDDFDMPVLRLPIPPNPDPLPFEPGLITDLFEQLLHDMQASREALVSVEGDAALRINLQDLWFDVNMNDMRDPFEGIMEIGAGMVLPRNQLAEMSGNIKVQFDTADVAWLTAYTHLISGVSELVIAFDPSAAISAVMQANVEMDRLRGVALERRGFISPNETDWLDQFAMVYGALNVEPDAVRTRAAHAHFLAMIAENKTFWAAVDAETDNDLEWIPNETQTAALGFAMPGGTGLAWQAILADAEAILNGELLVTHWRISPGAGINVNEMFMNPPVVDIVTWIQGYGLLPYMQDGPVATAQSIRQFEQLVSGNSLGFSFLLN